jgi:hypothetical protein
VCVVSQSALHTNAVPEPPAGSKQSESATQSYAAGAGVDPVVAHGLPTAAVPTCRQLVITVLPSMSSDVTPQFNPPVQSVPNKVQVGTQMPSSGEPLGSTMSAMHLCPAPHPLSSAQNFRQ